MQFHENTRQFLHERSLSVKILTHHTCLVAYATAKPLAIMLYFLHNRNMMRRKDRQQSESFARDLLTRALYGVLSLASDDGLPYAIPISFACVGDTIYIHGATEGTKLNLIVQNPKVVFVCVGLTHVLPQQFSTEYESVVVTGSARILQSRDEKRTGLLALAGKYSPDYLLEADSYMERAIDATAVIAITIEEITAKAKLPKEKSHD